MIFAELEPRCPTCATVLIHVGAICIACDAERHYESPHRTSPPFRYPEPEDDAENGEGEEAEKFDSLLDQTAV